MPETSPPKLQQGQGTVQELRQQQGVYNLAAQQPATGDSGWFTKNWWVVVVLVIAAVGLLSVGGIIAYIGRNRTRQIENYHRFP